MHSCRRFTHKDWHTVEAALSYIIKLCLNNERERQRDRGSQPDRQTDIQRAEGHQTTNSTF